MAMTADGKIATVNRRVSSFGSSRDQTHLYELRATADAVMAGARTLDLNQIQLGPGGGRFRRERLSRGLAEYNLRIIVTGSGTIDPRAAIFRRRFAPIIVLGTGRIPPLRLRRLRALADEVLLCGERQLDFALALHQLRHRWNVRRLLCEGGGDLNDALFRAKLVDELHLTICPKIFGGRNAPTIAEGTGVERLVQAARMRLRSSRRVGDELFLVFGADG
jgi:riboflavin-specific deaminase-like protein